MKRALCIKCSVIPSRHAPSSFSSSKLLTTTLPGSPQIGKRTMTAMNWSGCNGHGMAAHGGRPGLCLSCFFSLFLPSFLPLGSTQSISASSAMSECSPKTLTTKNRLTGFPGLPPGVASSTRPMGNHLTNERVSGGGEEPPKCPESLNNRRQIE